MCVGAGAAEGSKAETGLFNEQAGGEYRIIDVKTREQANELGYAHYQVLLQLSTGKHADGKQLIALLESKHDISMAELLIGPWDVSLHIVTKNHEDFLTRLDEIRTHLADDLAAFNFSVRRKELVRRVVV